MALAVALAAALIGCAHPPKISTALSAKRKSPDTVTIILKVKNLENRPTTPILVNVSAELHLGSAWDKTRPLMTPVAFVLNRNEEHTITANLTTSAESIRTLLTVKEAETGNLLKTQRAQLPLPAYVP